MYIYKWKIVQFSHQFLVLKSNLNWFQLSRTHLQMSPWWKHQSLIYINIKYHFHWIKITLKKKHKSRYFQRSLRPRIISRFDSEDFRRKSKHTELNKKENDETELRQYWPKWLRFTVSTNVLFCVGRLHEPCIQIRPVESLTYLISSKYFLIQN